ncbi:MAG: class I SAM-dependent methyltransferase [Candidatus Thioglobus sp.]|nr:class I SAM-dependent methyltransferase [Candidatus Pseudothioglobus aerophilus]
MINKIACPLCKTTNSSKFYKEKFREFLRCSSCDFVYVPKVYHLSDTEEKSRYDTHNNDPNDHRYRHFLSQLLVPLLERIKQQSNGLDFGSGPGPTLSLMLEECGHSVDLYDKFYANDISVFEKKYDFITATEVVEHLSEPMAEINRLIEMLNNQGYLAVMTQILTPQIDFSSWHYKNDPSHIGFFTKKSLSFLANYLNIEVYFISERVIFFQKNS